MRASIRHDIREAFMGVLVAVLVVGIGLVLLSIPATPTGLTEVVVQELPNSGVTNPVTAVLMNFRGYDTLLEVAVLLTALLGAKGLSAAPRTSLALNRSDLNPVLLGFIRVVSPLLIIVAGYLLWVGGHAPGGAFQAGSVLASLGVVLLMSGIRLPLWYTASIERWILVAGLVSFLLVGLGVMVVEQVLLQYPVDYAKKLILLIETACTASIAAILFALFAVGSPFATRKTSEDSMDSPK